MFQTTNQTPSEALPVPLFCDLPQSYIPWTTGSCRNKPKGTRYSRRAFMQIGQVLILGWCFQNCWKMNHTYNSKMHDVSLTTINSSLGRFGSYVIEHSKPLKPPAKHQNTTKTPPKQHMSKNITVTGIRRYPAEYTQPSQWSSSVSDGWLFSRWWCSPPLVQAACSAALSGTTCDFRGMLSTTEGTC